MLKLAIANTYHKYVELQLTTLIMTFETEVFKAVGVSPLKIHQPCPTGSDKCARYWPSEVGSSLIFGHVQVSLDEEKPLTGLVNEAVARTLSIKGKKTRRSWQLRIKAQMGLKCKAVTVMLSELFFRHCWRVTSSEKCTFTW